MRPTTRTCPVCGGTARYVTCGQVACRQAYQRDRNRTRMATQRASDHAYQHALEHYRRDSADEIEARFVKARNDRLREEAVAGQRKFRIGDDVTYVRQDGRVCVERAGWQQRAGRSCMDGEMRLTEMAEG